MNATYLLLVNNIEIRHTVMTTIMFEYAGRIWQCWSDNEYQDIFSLLLHSRLYCECQEWHELLKEI